MSLSQAFKLAMRSIVGSKMRSFLTMLGMIIGVGSVIAIAGLGAGVSDYMVQKLSDMGTNLLTVSITSTDTRKVSVDKMYQFAKDNSSLITDVSPMVTSKYTIKHGDDSLDATVYGVSEGYFNMKNYKVSLGRFLQYMDISARKNVCVVGSYIVNELYDGTVHIGDEIKINGKLYTIVGVQEELADSEENSTDDVVYIPYTNASRMSNAVISSYSIAAKDTDSVESVKTILDTYLYSIMKDEDLYNINTMTEMLDTINSMVSTFSLVLSGIAAISLVVAGIGIMNIMLVSVVERTKEIGIRKSLGAKKKDILRQFVIEAAVISTIGGCIGIFIGAFGTTELGNQFGVSATPPLNSILLAFGISMAIGVGFGYLPANKAAKLNPIDALRSD
jgi:ABC-type antimicrobial peptide transport system, permease component